jgi:ubiquitin carboxyl-terminal hydrolase 2/21
MQAAAAASTEVKEEITYKDIEEEGISAEEKGRRCWIFYLNKNCSIVTDLFLGQLRSTLRCTECRHESVTFEPFLAVSVPLSKDTNDIQACMELFVKAETLDGDEMPTCEKCKERRTCIKWYAFERWPEILVVHLKRFAPSGSYRGKLSSVIEVPLRHLDLGYCDCLIFQAILL